MPPEASHRLMKADALRGTASKIVFNYDDLRKQCDDYIEATRQQTQKMLLDALAEAEELRTRARQEGEADGKKRGLEEAQRIIEARSAELANARTAEQLRTTLPALQAAVSALQVERDRWLAWWEAAAVRLSVAIAEKLIRHEIEHRPESVVAVVSETLQLAAGNPHIKIRMHPADIEQLREYGQEVLHRLNSLGESALLPDEEITRGGCLIETRHGTIDARIETQLERITQELLERSL
jgi:flagellar assembly protein FliH